MFFFVMKMKFCLDLPPIVYIELPYFMLKDLSHIFVHSEQQLISIRTKNYNVVYLFQLGDKLILDQPFRIKLSSLQIFTKRRLVQYPEGRDHNSDRPYTIPKSNSIPFCKVEFILPITADSRESVNPASLLLVLSVRGQHCLQGYLAILSDGLTWLNRSIQRVLSFQR